MAMNPRLLLPRATGENRYKSLRVGLVAYWSMNETATSGDVTAEDWTGRGNNLTSNNTVPSVAGLQGNGRSFTAANTEWLSVTDRADIRFMDGRSWTVAGWLYIPTTWPNGQQFLSRDLVTTGNREIAFDCRISGGARRITCQTGPGTSPGIFLTAGDNATAGDRLAVNAWHFWAVTYDSGTRVGSIRVNSGTQSSETFTATLAAGTPAVGASPLNLGRRPDGSQYFTGRLDEVAKWDRVLTTAELNTLYNNGSGVDLRQ